MQVLDKRVLTVKMDGCKRPRRVYDILCEYFDVPHRGEIILEMEPYVAEDLQELVENVEKYNGETRNIAAELISIINGKSTDFDYIWLTY